MDTISYTAARSHLAKIMERVCEDHSPVIITRSKAASVVMLSLEDYEALQETTYLLRSPNNARRLTDAMAELEQDSWQEKKLLERSSFLPGVLGKTTCTSRKPTRKL
ncbi:antitoxin YefM [Vreelandella songnenensis]|uniref:Antitoxin n=1 Tax=Vreelandella songnenensis TaxID=1176243 RepID=A0A2T0V5L8_9GAMM|nr:antitoxin YefM [Halomonas songnenensis]